MPNILEIKSQLPDGFLNCHATQLHKIIPVPTLFHLDRPGQYKERLFISILLHGDETAGLLAMQSLLADSEFRLKHPLSLFVGNIEAAKSGVRRLQWQTDFNRCWPGGRESDSAEGQLMQQLVDEMSRHRLFASIDIHNNTGENPHYGCVNRLNHRYIYLASLFADQVVYFIRPTGVQSMAFARFCPAVTLECGSIGDLSGVEHAERYIRTVMDLDTLEPGESFDSKLRVYHTVSQIKLSPDVRFSFDGSAADIMFRPGLEKSNFHHLEPGMVLAEMPGKQDIPLIAKDEKGRDVSDRFFYKKDRQVVLKQAVIPAMLTTSEAAIRQDCLGYFMELLEIRDYC